MLIGYVVGSIVSSILFYFTDKMITESDTSSLRKVTKRVHIIYEVSYLFSFLGLGLIFQNWYVVIGLTCGLLIIRISIIIAFLFNRKAKDA